jgi:hypothetical protein
LHINVFKRVGLTDNRLLVLNIDGRDGRIALSRYFLCNARES